jgi:diguanylate cyclase (GGDEF)-like protein
VRANGGVAAWALASLAGPAVAVVLACALPPRAGAAEPAATAPASAASPGSYKPVDELDRLEYLGRSQPELAATGLLRLADSLKPDDPRYLETLMAAGGAQVRLAQGEQVEQIARRIEALADRIALARPAAMLLRGQWLDNYGEVAKAERQLIEASALLPPKPPTYLRLRLLVSDGDVKSRSGRYDEAMIRFNEALRLVDESAPRWQRADMRGLVSGVLIEAGQPEKATDFINEQMRVAVEDNDHIGMADAWTARAILLSDGPDSAGTLAAWRAALEHSRLSGNKRVVVLSLANIADYYIKHEDYATAYDMSMRALPMAREMKTSEAESVALANAGLALIGMKRKDEGVPLVRQSMALEERTGSARSIADSARELGDALEKAGYPQDALAAYRQYRQLATALNQQDRQRALIELQEGFANDRRQHELDMLAREGRLKDEQLLHHDLEMKQWTAAGLSILLLLAVVAALARRLRVRNQQLSASNEQLRIQAEIDPLTGLANRHHLQAVMAARPGACLEGSVYLIDIDHFKAINDRFGHAGGDAVLIEIARRLRATLRDEDLVVRWGGEEFLVLVRPLPAGEAEALAQRLLCVLADVPVSYEERTVPITASIGYGVFPLRSHAAHAGPGHEAPEVEVKWERAVALADSAMYLAKAHGRNGACGIRRIDAADAAAVEELGRNLEAAWHDGRVELHLHPGPVREEVAA